MSKKISIIIPVYNGEKYISRCIDSVLNQKDFDINDLEILLLNDGSKDSSLKILRQYAKKYPKIIKVLAHKNMGVARTRNKGISLATGKYIMFIDQDDWVDTDYCNAFYCSIESNRLDVVSGGYRRPDNKNNICNISKPKDTDYQKYIIMAAWAKIHRTSFLRKNNILFFDNKVGEDSVFTVNEINATCKWKIIDYIGYNWFYNFKSVSNTKQKKLGTQEIKSLTLLLDKLNSINKDKDNKLFSYYLVRTCVYYLLFSGRHSKKEEFLYAHFKFKKYLDKELNHKNFILYGPKGESTRVKIVILLFVAIYRLNLIKIFARAYCRGY